MKKTAEEILSVIVKARPELLDTSAHMRVSDALSAMREFANQSKWIPIADAELIEQDAYWCYPSPKEEVEPMSYIDGVFYSQTNEYEKSVITHVQPYVIPLHPKSKNQTS